MDHYFIPRDVTNETSREHKTPPQVYGLSWKIDGKHYLTFNDYGTIDLSNREKHGVQGRITIKDARRFGAALLAAVAAYEGTKPVVPRVEVEDWKTDQLIQHGRKALKEIDELIDRLNEVRKGLAERVKPGTSNPDTEVI